jgi:hypothetical protein
MHLPKGSEYQTQLSHSTRQNKVQYKTCIAAMKTQWIQLPLRRLVNLDVKRKNGRSGAFSKDTSVVANVVFSIHHLEWLAYVRKRPKKK